MISASDMWAIGTFMRYAPMRPVLPKHKKQLHFREIVDKCMDLDAVVQTYLAGPPTCHWRTVRPYTPFPMRGLVGPFREEPIWKKFIIDLKEWKRVHGRDDEMLREMKRRAKEIAYFSRRYYLSMLTESHVVYRSMSMVCLWMWCHYDHIIRLVSRGRTYGDKDVHGLMLPAWRRDPAYVCLVRLVHPV